ncbi:MAG: lipoprotein signal peptidase [Pseudomonadales bacterium]|nr:lipoprotein signal peptidase [Pseudomonadales bacterium]
MIPVKKYSNQLKWCALSAFILIADQVTKIVIMDNFDLYDRLRVLPFFDLVRAHNPGAAFSFLADASGWQRIFFVTVSSVVSLALVVWLLRVDSRQKIQALGLSLVLGGALGNLYDRIAYGYVIDFLLFYSDQYSFPAFNVADAAITVGAFFLIVDMIKNPQAGKS